MEYFINELDDTALVVINGTSFPIPLSSIRGAADDFIKRCKSGCMLGLPYSQYDGDVELSEEEFLEL